MEIARVVTGVAAAILISYGVPFLRRKWPYALTISIIYATYSVVTVTTLWRSVALVVFAASVAMALIAVSSRDRNSQRLPDVEATEPDRARWMSLASPVPLVIISIVIVLWLCAGNQTFMYMTNLLRDSRIAIAGSGFLIATFSCGELVTHSLSPFARDLDKDGEREMNSLRGAGAVIGWFERGLMYSFLIGGHTTAAAMVVALKALARFPELEKHQKGFAEYFLIGTFVSIASAAALAILIRRLIYMKGF